MVKLLSEETWNGLGGTRSSSKWDEVWVQLHKGKIVFVPLGKNRNTTTTSLYDRSKRENVKIALHKFVHEGEDGFAVKITGPRS